MTKPTRRDIECAKAIGRIAQHDHQGFRYVSLNGAANLIAAHVAQETKALREALHAMDKIGDKIWHNMRSPVWKKAVNEYRRQVQFIVSQIDHTSVALTNTAQQKEV